MTHLKREMRAFLEEKLFHLVVQSLGVWTVQAAGRGIMTKADYVHHTPEGRLERPEGDPVVGHRCHVTSAAENQH